MRTIQSIWLCDILSFGGEGEELELQPLNVLIGPNASGKSNLIEIFRLLRALPSNPSQIIREGGGVSEWLWKGGDPVPFAMIILKAGQVEYRLKFTKVGYRWEIIEEHIVISGQRIERNSAHNPEFSLLANLKDDPQVSSLIETLSSIGIYKEWNPGRFSLLKSPQRPDLPSRPLLEDLSNFGLVFNNLPHRLKLKITEQLTQIYDGVEEVRTQIDGGTVQVLIQEKGLSSPTPLARVSDGTLRFLFLLTLLNQPELPPVICIEEPESGLHPDVIHTVAELLIEASQHTQIIVTSHSEQLVSALSEVPEAIIVCERDETVTHLRRLDPEQWKVWLEKYTLGDLWRRGDLGGVRW
ncbi:MAG TPA: AAA family ATPase [Blastocatellia bacterium]|nr:AAA family ATPase [Blastocatellia bacterium]